MATNTTCDLCGVTKTREDSCLGWLWFRGDIDVCPECMSARPREATIAAIMSRIKSQVTEEVDAFLKRKSRDKEFNGDLPPGFGSDFGE